MRKFFPLVLVLSAMMSCRGSSAKKSEDGKNIDLEILFTGDLAYLDFPNEELDFVASGYAGGQELDSSQLDKRVKLNFRFVDRNEGLSSRKSYRLTAFMNFTVPAGSTSFKLKLGKILGKECTLTPSEGEIDYVFSQVNDRQSVEIATSCTPTHVYPIRGVVKGNTHDVSIRLTGPHQDKSLKTYQAASDEKGTPFDFENLTWTWDDLVDQSKTAFSDEDYANTGLNDFLSTEPHDRAYGDGWAPYRHNRSLRAKVEIVQQSESDICEIENNSDLIAGYRDTDAYDCEAVDGCSTDKFLVKWIKTFKDIVVACSPRPIYKVSGSVSGQTGALTLKVGSESVTIGATDSSFQVSVFGKKDHELSITAAPVNQICSLNTGSIADLSADLSDIVITCANNAFKLGGTVSGLGAGTLVLSVNSAEDQSISANGSFEFQNALAKGTAYTVTIKTQAATYHCELSNATGTLNADTSNISVSCVPKKLIYVTAATAANFGGVAGADALCDSGKPSAGT